MMLRKMPVMRSNLGGLLIINLVITFAIPGAGAQVINVTGFHSSTPTAPSPTFFAQLPLGRLAAVLTGLKNRLTYTVTVTDADHAGDVESLVGTVSSLRAAVVAPGEAGGGDHGANTLCVAGEGEVGEHCAHVQQGGKLNSELAR